MAPLHSPRSRSKIIPGRYIVRLKSPPDNPSASVLAISAMHIQWLANVIANVHFGSQIHHVYDLEEMSGYAGDFSEGLLQEIRRRPEVAYIEPDQVVHLMDEHFLAASPDSILDWRSFLGGSLKRRPKSVITSRPRSHRADLRLLKGQNREHSSAERTRKRKRATKIQRNAPWGLKRLSNKIMPAAGEGEFRYPESAGDGVDVYVIDTGINIHHLDFEGRAVWGKTIPLFDEDIDGNGHGTHCSGTIVGRRFGVAKKARVHAVKVLMSSGFGTNSDVIAGVQWVIDKHRKRRRRGRKTVANMSLGGGKSKMLEENVDFAVRSGVHFAVAAGNDNEDACEYSPAGASKPVKVGAVDMNDAMAYFSNYGPCVDLFAPGVNITSAWIGSRLATNTISGTSMASPHVAGVLALYLGERSYSTCHLKRLLLGHARKNVIEEIPKDANTVNRLVCIDRLII